MNFLSRQQVFAEVEKQEHVIFTNDSKNYNLNVIAIRSKEAKVDKFGCQLMLAWKYKGKWFTRNYKITTYPGSYYLTQRLLNSAGTAILHPGQYRGVYGIRKHNNKYEAMCQTWGPVKVFRDGNRDMKFDLLPSRTFWGNYGINIHRSVMNGCTHKVGSHSAGCLVFSCAIDFNDFMKIIKASRESFGNKFTLTLIDEP